MEPVHLQLTREEVECGPRVLCQNAVSETFPLHTHDFYEFFLITCGKAIHSINDSQQLLTEGSLVFIRPDDVHCYKAINYFDFQILSVGFSYDEIAPLLAYLGLPKSLIDKPELPVHFKFTGIQYEYLKETMLQISGLFPGSQCRPLLRALMGTVFYPLIDANMECINNNLQTIPNWLFELDQKMSDRANYIAGLPRLLELCNYSRSHVMRSFQIYFKMTPTEYINTKRMEYACELILENQYSIAEICYMSGFGNLSYFYSVFNKLYRCTPKDFFRKYAAHI